MSRVLAIALVCTGLCLVWVRGSAQAAGEAATTTPTSTPTPTPTVRPNVTEGEAVLAPEPPRATLEPASPRPPRKPRRHRQAARKHRPQDAEPAPAALPALPADPFRIPAFLLPIYRAAGSRYGVAWPVLAAINEIETDYGRNLNVSSAGAVGWMQFMPESWTRYGVDANADGVNDPYDPSDAIFAAARYLRAAGSERDLRAAVFAYNHADWYVDSVLERARRIAGLPAEVVGSLTGLGEGRFPVDAPATYGPQPVGDPASIEPRPRRGAIRIFARRGAAVIAVAPGRIVGLGEEAGLGRFARLRDAAGNTFTYAHLATLARTYPAPRPAARRRAVGRPRKRRLFAHPDRPRARVAGGARQLAALVPLPRLAGLPPLAREDYVARRLVPGARVSAGTILGRLGRTPDGTAPHVLFEIRLAGGRVPPISPVPILEGWKLGARSVAGGRPGPRPWGSRPGVRLHLTDHPEAVPGPRSH